MRGKCPIAALPDQIYERLSNDNEHPFTSLDEIAGLPARPRTGRARAGPRSRIIGRSSPSGNEIQRGGPG
jgi:hypothetical protein